MILQESKKSGKGRGKQVEWEESTSDTVKHYSVKMKAIQLIPPPPSSLSYYTSPQRARIAEVSQT